MKRTTQMLAGFSLFAFTFAASMPVPVHGHGGIGGYHASYAGGAHVSGVHAGGISATGVHAGGINATGFHAGAVGGVAGVGHVGYYPHYNAGVGYYHPVARATAWGPAYAGYGYAGLGYAGYGSGGDNPYPYATNSVDTTSAQLDGITGFGQSQAGESTQQQLDADLKKNNDK